MGEVSIEVLGPDPAMIGSTIVDNVTNVNNSSLVMRFDYGEHSSLFTGDVYKTAELAVATGFDPVDIAVFNRYKGTKTTIYGQRGRLRPRQLRQGRRAGLRDQPRALGKERLRPAEQGLIRSNT